MMSTATLDARITTILKRNIYSGVSKLRQRKLLSKIIFAIFGLAVFLLAYQLGNQYAQPYKQNTNAFLLPEPLVLQPFSLIDQNDAAFDLQDLTGYWTLLILGDHRLEACKRFMTTYVMAWNRLAHDKQLQAMTRAVFLTLAPTNHPDAELKSFIEFIHPDFVGLRGEKSEVQQLAAQMGLAEVADNSVQCAELDSIVALINPHAQLSAIFTGISNPAIIAHDLETIAHH